MVVGLFGPIGVLVVLAVVLVSESEIGHVWHPDLETEGKIVPVMSYRIKSVIALLHAQVYYSYFLCVIMSHIGYNIIIIGFQK